MLVSLYTVRVVLNVLGAEDYGIYNVVAGVVTMFGFLSGAMATASQRYFAFDLGKKDYEHLRTTFSVTFQIYVLLAAIIVVLAETIGLWFVMNKLVIPPERMTAAIWIYQAAVFSFLLTLITTPYMASIIAHENMNIYAYVSIVEAVLKLAIVFVLQVLDYDKLILYALLLTSVGIITTAIYRIYCKKN
ncbi:MAG: polysaccharide biosynthesis protein, partial [Bacteroidales bacterium]|nr:polysaccharide biosynthesis protein [Bacteroidales bacterium]